jgi:hypothetical protein
VQNYKFAVSQAAQTSLRSVIGQSDMDQLLSEREKVNAHLKDVIDAPTEQPWGIRVERVEVKDVALPESMKRSTSRQAEAERERRARIISADGEYQASKKLAQAATVMAADPAALQLRLLQTVVEAAAEKNSTLVMPIPVELLRFSAHAQPRPPPTPSPRPPTPRTPAPRRRPCPKYPPSQCQPAPPSPRRSTPPPKHQPLSDRCHSGSQPQREPATACMSMHPSGTFGSSSPVASATCSPTAAISTGLRRDRRGLSYAAGATLPRRAK